MFIDLISTSGGWSDLAWQAVRGGRSVDRCALNSTHGFSQHHTGREAESISGHLTSFANKSRPPHPSVHHLEKASKSEEASCTRECEWTSVRGKSGMNEMVEHWAPKPGQTKDGRGHSRRIIMIGERRVARGRGAGGEDGEGTSQR